jgi:hypothetical protein
LRIFSSFCWKLTIVGGADSDEKDISIAAIKNKYKKNKKTAM